MSQVKTDHLVHTESPKDSLRLLVLMIKDWLKYLFSKRVIIIISFIVGAILGVVYSIVRKPIFTAQLSFVLEEGDKVGAIGQYAGLASMMGIDLGGGAGGLFKGDNILELYKSRTMITSTLLSHSKENDSLLIDRFINLRGWRQDWKEDPGLSSINFHIPRIEFSRQHDSLLNVVVNDLNEKCLKVFKPDKKLSLITVEVRSTQESFAKDFTEQIVKNVNQFYVETKTKKSSENLAILQQQTDSVRSMLDKAIGGVAAASEANPNPNSALYRLQVPSSRKQVDVQANQAILSELVKNLELSKVSLRKETPLIQIIDEPVYPLPKSHVSKLMGLIVGGVLFSMFAVLALLTRKIWRSVMYESTETVLKK